MLTENYNIFTAYLTGSSQREGTFITKHANFDDRMQ